MLPLCFHYASVMQIMSRLTFTTLAQRLERAVQCDVGIEGLNILIHGWLRKGPVSRQTLRVRKHRDGEPWLTYAEALSFSRYAGYNLADD